MNRTTLKALAADAKKELMKKIETKALKLGITEDTHDLDGKQLSGEAKTQRNKLILRIKQIGFYQVLEEVAYTWFNRFTALRFMEVNDYLPTGVRALSSANPQNPEPEIIKEALSLDLELDKELVYELKLGNKTEELFKYLIIKQCNDLNKYLPFMFETIDDYTEILFPEGLLSKDSFVRQMTDTAKIPEEDWQNVEIIGWLYQYYIAEEKDRVIKAKKKYETEEIPFATQLFTPDWIVRYMVQNSLGRYWVESHAQDHDLIANWEFYLENPNPTLDLEEKLAPYLNKALKVEDIKCFDPAMGSGHILVYMFDVLFEIYSKCGYMEREIPRLIIENNLYGLDIDDRAYQLACFSVVMKALQYNPRFLRSIEGEGLQLHLASIQETNTLQDEEIADIAGEHAGDHFDQVKTFIKQFLHAKSLGSIIRVDEYDKGFMDDRLASIQQHPAQDLFAIEARKRTLHIFPKLLKQAEIMSCRYDILVTNPPYMGSNFMIGPLSEYVKKEYPSTKSDLFSIFIEWGFSKVKENGLLGYMTPFVWMFLSSYEPLRKKLIEEKNISSLIQLEYSAFEEATVPICTFTLRNYKSQTPGEFIQLSHFRGAQLQPIKTLEAIQNPAVPYRFTQFISHFTKIPGHPIAYWFSKQKIETFAKSKRLDDFGATGKGIGTGDNEKFLKLWFEVDVNQFSVFGNGAMGYKWFPYNKGGEYRKWYGNNEYVINWENNGQELKNIPNAYLRNQQFYFKPGLTWTKVTSSKFSMREFDRGFLFDDGGCCFFPDDSDRTRYFLGLLNSKIFLLLGEINPTLNFQPGDIAKTPIFLADPAVMDTITTLSRENVAISKEDWDSFETSWDFTRHPLLQTKGATGTISEAFCSWSMKKEAMFAQLKSNEEKMNQLFLEIYELQEDMTPEVEDIEITIRKGKLEREIKSFISYAVGCMFGRYSLDEEGLIFAGGTFTPHRYQTFPADQDNILPILSGTNCEDDIVSRFTKFVEVTFGEETLAQNLNFIADNLGKKRAETAKETIRRYFLHDFFKDHVQTYKKRPVYWFFTSGKQKAFNCLIYMHRYDKTTVSRIRTDYLHDLQIRLDAEMKALLSVIEGDSTPKEISEAKKEWKALEKKMVELKEYDERLHHTADLQVEMDLDEGVVVNYEKFQGLLAKL